MDILKKIIVVCFCLGSFILLLKVFLLSSYPDFNVFYTSTTSYLVGGDPYLHGQKGIDLLFLYPPFAFLLFLPFTLVPIQIAGVMWNIISVGLLLFSIILLFITFDRKLWTTEFFIITGLVFWMFPVKFTLGMGEINIIILFLVTCTVYFLKREKKVESGSFLGLAFLLKLTPLLLLLYYPLKREWKGFIAILLTGMFGLLISFFNIRFEVYRHFFTGTLLGLANAWPLDYYNQSLTGLIGRSLGRTELASTLRLLICCVIVASTALVIYKNRADKLLLGFISFLPLSLLVAPLAWQHHFVLLIPAFILMYFVLSNRHNKPSLALLLLSYLLISVNLTNPHSVPTLVQSHVTFGTMLLLILIVREIGNYE